MAPPKEAGLRWSARLGAVGVGLILGLAWLSVSLYFLYRVRDADLLRSLADRVRIELLESRRREKDFLLRSLVDSEFYRTGTTPYLDLHRAFQQEMAVDAENLLRRIPPAWPEDYHPLVDRRRDYEDAFTALVESRRRLGWKDFGLEGAWHQSGRDLERVVLATAKPALRVRLLELHAGETTYLLRTDPRSLRAVQESALALRESVGTALASPAGEIEGLIDRYLRDLDAYHAVELEVGATEELGLNARLRSAAHNIEPLVFRVSEHADAEYALSLRRLGWGFAISSLGFSALLSATLLLAVQAGRRSRLLSETAAELSRSNAELQQFAYVASHDLQEPLRAVAGCVQLLEQHARGRLDDRGSQYVRHAVEGCVRMETLITDLLTLSRVGSPSARPAPVDSGKVLAAALENLSVPIRESGAVVTHDSMPPLGMEPTQLLQLLQNLLGNALKFRSGRPPAIHVGAVRDGKGWRLSVRDNGIGIEPQYFERIFRVFQRLHTRQEFPGSGIGLAVCEKIVLRHGGRIWVESTPGQGSTFSFTVPDGN